MEPIDRITARVLPVCPEGEVLLLLDQDPAHPGVLRWGTIGGGVDDGEDHRQAAVRELFEETGIEAVTEDLTPPFHTGTLAYSYDGVAYVGHSTFFALALDRDVAITFEHLEPIEVGNVVEARWMTPGEAAADGRLVAPELPDIMAAAITAARDAS